MRPVQPCQGDVQLAGQLHPLWPDPPRRDRLPVAPVHQLWRPPPCRHARLSPVAETVTSCHHNGIVHHCPLQTSSPCSSTRRKQGGSHLCECHEGTRPSCKTCPSAMLPPPPVVDLTVAAAAVPVVLTAAVPPVGGLCFAASRAPATDHLPAGSGIAADRQPSWLVLQPWGVTAAARVLSSGTLTRWGGGISVFASHSHYHHFQVRVCACVVGLFFCPCFVVRPIFAFQVTS